MFKKIFASLLILAMTTTWMIPVVAAPSISTTSGINNPVLWGGSPGTSTTGGVTLVSPTAAQIQAIVQNPTGYVETLKAAAAYQMAQAVLQGLGLSNIGVGTGQLLCSDCPSEMSTNADLATLVMQALFQGKTLPSDTLATVGGLLNGGTNTTPIDIAASTVDPLDFQLPSTEGTIGNLVSGTGGLGGISGSGLGTGDLGGFGGIFGNGSGDISGSGLGSGTAGGGLPGGLLNSADGTCLTYSYSANHSFVKGKATISPAFPLKDKSFTITALGEASPPAGSVSFGLNPVVETITKDTAGNYTKTYAIQYTYYPPKASPQGGTLTIKVAYSVAEVSAFGGASGGNYDPTGQSGGTTVSSLDLGGGFSGFGGVNGGNQLAGQAGAGQSSGIFGTGADSAGTLNLKQALGVLTGGVDMPFGAMTNGATNVNISIPGFDSFGSNLLSINDTIHNLLLGMDSPKTEQQQRNSVVAVQSNQTPDQVRRQNFGSMTGILKTSASLLMAQGKSAKDIPGLYDKDSAYTSPKDAWDMNRLTNYTAAFE